MSAIRIEHGREMLHTDRPVVVIYRDEGPGAPCGQSVEATSPKGHVWGPMSYDEARAILRQMEGERGGRNARVSMLNWAETPAQFGAPADGEYGGGAT